MRRGTSQMRRGRCAPQLALARQDQRCSFGGARGCDTAMAPQKRFKGALGATDVAIGIGVLVVADRRLHTPRPNKTFSQHTSQDEYAAASTLRPARSRQSHNAHTARARGTAADGRVNGRERARARTRSSTCARASARTHCAHGVRNVRTHTQSRKRTCVSRRALVHAHRHVSSHPHARVSLEHARTALVHASAKRIGARKRQANR
eukprot:2317905-Pleurochrysis_carterae.AAC.1